MHPYECAHTHTHTHREQHTHVHEPWRRGYRQALSLEESLRSSNDNERGGVRGGRCWWGRLSSCLQVSLWCWRGQLTSTHSADTMDAQFKLRVTGWDKLRFTSVAGVGRCVEPRFVQVIDIYQVEQLVPKTTETTHHKFRIISVKRKWMFMFQNGTLQTISWLWKKKHWVQCIWIQHPYDSMSAKPRTQSLGESGNGWETLCFDQFHCYLTQIP